ncbi:DJ-1/PfpI family protein [Faecalibacter sp. LW9]|uniref:DJ-1/PfpI family protein n=1 Tax=Faecalibacter sp. LW9 TaxID=3103144 RepID=UPI002AFF8275|nr:DJ-1/PfpI family protein [Faecalibacter sp. LW9]
MNKKVAILTEKGFEEIELTSPKQALEDAGFTTAVISPQQGKVKAKSGMIGRKITLLTYNYRMQKRKIMMLYYCPAEL